MPRFRLRTLILVISICAVVFALLSALMSARESARRTTCQSKLRQLGLAMLNYDSANQYLPMGVEMDSAGMPSQSWRVHLFSYTESSCWYWEYDHRAAWNSKQNIRAVARYPDLETWSCPSCSRRHSNQINYAVVVGEETAFPPNRNVKLEEITDGPENTILLVETLLESQCWTEPLDLEFSSMNFTIGRSTNGLSSYHPGGVNVCFADGNTYFLTSEISPDELKALLTISGGEPVTRQSLIERGLLR